MKASGFSFTLTTLILLFLATGCQSAGVELIPATTHTTPPADIATATVTFPPPAPLGTGMDIQTHSQERLPITAQNTRNVRPSLLLGSGDEVSAYPENASDMLKAAIDTFYRSIEKNYSGSTVYFNQDSAPGGTGQWILYAVTADGKLVYSLTEYANEQGTPGPEQYNDYPVVFDPHTGEMTGEYTLLDIPGGSVGVIWDKGLPQFLANEQKTQAGDRYYTEVMNYKVFYPDDPWVSVPGVAELVATPEPTNPAELSSKQLAEKKLVGSGFELKTEYQGIPVDLTVVTSKATLTQYKQTQGCFPNQKMKEYGASAEDRMAEMVFLGHYVGILRDRGLTEVGYPFTQYIADLKAGADRSYSIWGPRLDGSDGEFRINPSSPVEAVFTNSVVDPDGNGRATAWEGDYGRLGYQQLENGGVRIIQVVGNTYRDYSTFCGESTSKLASVLLILGSPINQLKGNIQLRINRSDYPTTYDRMYKIPVELQIPKNPSDLYNTGLLRP
jgi:hypothetical protein